MYNKFQKAQTKFSHIIALGLKPKKFHVSYRAFKQVDIQFTKDRK